MTGTHRRFFASAGIWAVVIPAISSGNDSFRSQSEHVVRAAAHLESLKPAYGDWLVQEAPAVSADSAIQNAPAVTSVADDAGSPSDVTPSEASSSGETPATTDSAPAATSENSPQSDTASPTTVQAASPTTGSPGSTNTHGGFQGQYFTASPTCCACPKSCDGPTCSFGLWDSGCDSCDSLGCAGALFGAIKTSEPCFNDFISPMTNPVYFEDPRTLTEVRFLFLNHELPASLGGNSIQVYAAQFRVALSQRLSLLVTKDGLVYTQSPFLDHGFANVNAGFKYNLLRDPQAGMIVSGGITYEIPLGSEKSLQGIGDGEFNFFLTGGTRILGSRRAHFLTTAGLRQPLDESIGSRIAYWSNHIDFRLPTRVPTYAFTEVNWWHYINEGAAGGPLSIPEGADLFNFGTATPGTDLVTQAVGLRAKLRSNIETGAAYEFPISSTDGIFRERLTMDFIVRY